MSLRELDYRIVEELADDEWRSVGYFAKTLDLGGDAWYRIELVCERAAADGYFERRSTPGSGRRCFRRPLP